ncbi:MAG: hypothetical protein ACI4QZ_00060 [Eubacteriales bacterium]
MSEKCYSIVMKTPLGKKYGTLTASANGNLLRGWLDILEHKEPFEGTIDCAGNCRITGKLITLVRTVSFVATGKLTASAVNLQMQGERNVFELSGELCSDGGETEKCEDSIHG